MKYLGNCIHCNSAMYYDDDSEMLRTTGVNCMCEAEPEERLLSACCCAPKRTDSDICSDCNEPAEFEKA